MNWIPASFALSKWTVSANIAAHQSSNPTWAFRPRRQCQRIQPNNDCKERGPSCTCHRRVPPPWHLEGAGAGSSSNDVMFVQGRWTSNIREGEFLSASSFLSWDEKAWYLYNSSESPWLQSDDERPCSPQRRHKILLVLLKYRLKYRLMIPPIVIFIDPARMTLASFVTNHRFLQEDGRSWLGCE